MEKMKKICILLLAMLFVVAGCGKKAVDEGKNSETPNAEISESAKKGEFEKQLASYKKSGYVRVYVDGIVYSLDEEIKSEIGIVSRIKIDFSKPMKKVKSILLNENN